MSESNNAAPATALRAVVVTDLRVWLGRYGGVQTLEYRPAQFDTLAGALAWCAERMTGDGALIVPGTAAALPDHRIDLARAEVDGTRADGWSGTPAVTLAEHGWGTFVRHGRSFAVGVAAWWDEGREGLIDSRTGAGDMAQRLALYHALTGGPWRGTAGVSGCGVLRSTVNVSRPGWMPEPLWRWDLGPSGMFEPPPTDLHWRRDLTRAELLSRDVHTFDVRAMYLAAAAQVELAWGGLFPAAAAELANPHDTLGGLPGMYRIGVPAAGWATPDRLRPPIIPPTRLREDGTAWVAEPVVRYLRDDLRVPVKVREAWVGRQHHRLLRPWADKLRDALVMGRCPVGSVMRDAVSQTYRETVGMFGRPGGRICRPDWRAAILDLARVNLYRKIDAAWASLGVAPCEVRTDEVTYAGVVAPGVLASALRCGPQIGHLRPTGTVGMPEYLQDRAPVSDALSAVSGGAA